MASMTASSVDFLNRLLRGQLSAVETYEMGVAKLGSEPGAMELQRILSEHRQNAETLRSHVTSLGGTPSTSSGPWGTFAELVTGGAKLFGNVATLRALQQGESHGLAEYERALEDSSVEDVCKDLIRSEFLPRQREHIATLDRLMEVQNSK